jgi:hypothetical protein
MSMVFIAVLVLSASPGEGLIWPETPQPAASPAAPANKVQQPLLPLRTGRELERAAHAALRRWAKADEHDADAAARQFIVLYKELQSDTRMAASERELLRTKIRGRLVQLSQIIVRREARLAKERPASVLHLGPAGGVLAQQAPQGFGPAGGAGGGGPVGNADDDNGQQLVDLIQSTISPQTWDVNGGPGSIYYWRPQRALVISAPGEVHDAVGDVLEQLNRAGN